MIRRRSDNGPVHVPLSGFYGDLGFGQRPRKDKKLHRQRTVTFHQSPQATSHNAYNALMSVCGD